MSKEIAWLSDECLLCKNSNPDANLIDFEEEQFDQLCTPHFMRLVYREIENPMAKEFFAKESN